MDVAKICSLKFLPPNSLELHLSDGSKWEIDMSSKMKTARFMEIQEWHVFSSGKLLDGERIVWDCGVELTLAEIYQNKHRKEGEA